MLLINAVNAEGRPVELYVKDGKIAAVGQDLAALAGENETVLDAGGLTVLPAFVDLHCHWRTPGFEYKEDIETGSRAAAAGGYTFVNLMPNTKPVCSSAAQAAMVEQKAAEVGLCDVNQTVSITEDFDGKTIDMLAPKTLKGMKFRIETSVLDCLGCGNCADVCPGKKNKETGEIEKALKMVPFNVDAPDMKKEAENWTYLTNNVKSKQDLVDIKQSPKNSQFAQPLFEFSGACSGCGETPYVKLISQLFGDREMIANATGCSSIYSASIPSTPYCKNEKGQGPAFDNSLFEDFCEFGLGMALGNKKMKERITVLLNQAMEGEHTPDDFKAAAQKWIEQKNDADGSKAAAAELKPLIEKGAEAGCPFCKELQPLEHYLVKRSQWIIGGDGASYDIGYGGLDHVLSTGEDVNILVLDTEVYSNTGGQSSKATPLGAIAQFAAQGKRVRKKDLGLMQTTYGYVYVAQVAMGADNAQCLKAIREAEAYPGPSLVIAYAPCINHGIKGTKKLKRSMGKSQMEEKLAVDCGYWHLWRFNPELADQGKNPFTLDSKEPNWADFREFLLGEVRYSSVAKAYPAEADELFSECEKMAKLRYKSYVRKSQEDWSEE